MNRSRLLFLLVFAALLLVPVLAPAPPAQAQMCLGGNTTSPGGGTASHWGKGSTCAGASSNLASQLNGATNLYCDQQGQITACNVSVVETTGCYWVPSYGQYVVDGYADFGCQGWQLD